MILDIFIILFSISALFRGREIGFVRQALSTIGFFGGLFIGATLEPRTVQLVNSASAKSVVTLVTTLGFALLFLIIGEYIGITVKHKVMLNRLNKLDNGLGAGLGVITLLIAVWLSSSIINGLPFPTIKAEISSSRVVAFLDDQLPSAPNIVSHLGQLINPNGFPQVFIGGEPIGNDSRPLPDLGDLQSAVNSTKLSVVKLEGQGCGGVVDGSGFVIAPGLVGTNAHVIAGIRKPYVQDSKGTHSATPIWFDSKLDFAIVRVANLAGSSLDISSNHVTNGSPAVVLGFPGGGAFRADPAVILDQFLASGRDIYGKGSTIRAVYEVKAGIIPGNSGGPLVSKDGHVIGVVFAESTTRQNVGYVLTAPQIKQAIQSAVDRNQTTSTGTCAG
jgi:S1-C subfamily serine protease